MNLTIYLVLPSHFLEFQPLAELVLQSKHKAVKHKLFLATGYPPAKSVPFEYFSFNFYCGKFQTFTKNTQIHIINLHVPSRGFNNDQVMASLVLSILLPNLPPILF